MIPARIQGATRILGMPSDWDAVRLGPVAGLPICDFVDERGMKWMASAWTPLPEELSALQAGGSVLLMIQGSHHPVVGCGVSEPAP